MGKSTLILGLSRAMSHVREKEYNSCSTGSAQHESFGITGNCEVLRVNPKAMEESLLFGKIDSNTTEWLDGIVAAVRSVHWEFAGYFLSSTQ